LRLDQGILIAGERSQLLHGGAIRLQSAQFRQVKATQFGQHMRVNAVGLGSGRFAQVIGGLRVHRIDGDAGLQQERDEQAVVRFDNTGQLLRRSRDVEQKRFQHVQAVVGVGKAPRSHALTRFIQHIYVMMGVCPIQHTTYSWVHISRNSWGVGSLYSGCSKHVPPIIDWPRKAARGSTISLCRSSRVEEKVFPRQGLFSRLSPALPFVKRVWKHINI
jgi:hypothetical protein